MSILGAHMSIAGGFDKAVERGATAGCDCIQIFSKNNNQWRAREIRAEEAEAFRRALDEYGISHPIAHDSYLINLASPEDGLWKKSIDAFVVELLRAEMLGVPYVVTHPGSFTSSSEAAGLKRIVAALDEVHAQCRGIRAKCLLETTAGQGTNLGWRFEQLAALLDGVQDPGRLDVCVDTCHVFAAGYPLSPEADYERTLDEFDRLIGLERIRAFHLNDSKRELGSRIDRHENIGEGCLGLDPFRLLLNDPRFQHAPMYLETEKGQRNGRDLDAINLETLRGLVGTRRRKK